MKSCPGPNWLPMQCPNSALIPYNCICCNECSDLNTYGQEEYIKFIGYSMCIINIYIIARKSQYEAIHDLCVYIVSIIMLIFGSNSEEYAKYVDHWNNYNDFPSLPSGE